MSAAIPKKVAKRAVAPKRTPKPALAAYHFTMSGLPNVWLLNGFRYVETPGGERAVQIDDLDGLHNALARSLVTEKVALGASEVRFLRKFLRQSQAGLAALLGCKDQTVARWEKGTTAIDPSAERLVRMLVLWELDEDTDLRAELAALAERDESLHGERRLEHAGKAWRRAA